MDDVSAWPGHITAGCIVHGLRQRSAWDHLCRPLIPLSLSNTPGPSFLLLHSQDYSSLGLLVLPCPAGLLLPDASTACSLPTSLRVLTHKLLLFMFHIESIYFKKVYIFTVHIFHISTVQRWDEPIPETLRTWWKTLVEDLPSSPHFQVPRYMAAPFQ